MLRIVLPIIACTLLGTVVLSQEPEDEFLQARLARLFPDAASFSGKEGNPPHFKAFGPAPNGGEAPLIGLAYWTTELDPLERAYDGPIKMLVGIDTRGVLQGVIVVDHREPYGYFSVDLPEFEEQFVEKSVREAFQPGRDIDAISRATITINSASRAVRNSSRRIARALLTPPEE